MSAAALPLLLGGPPGWLVFGVLAVATAGAVYVMSETGEDADQSADEQLSSQSATTACSDCHPDGPDDDDDSKDPNKVDHIFGDKQLQKHKLDQYLESFDGDKAQAYRALQNATRNAVRATSGPFQTVVRSNGFNVTVRGAVVNGVPRLSTAFIP
ncbi:hypothetical protein LQ948_15935 [Jiella sp. MQZ9-1]|uniref:Uncharacterized protein n=1 Tax=Jiella flava TaxID=2816857 RepID=A0A939G2Z5_9HYPH|nr:hypothetical protein [Jiella flava]MBO0664124.1 hypothetical protein [Jiella flava]MCD2472696.1 hypothetical protein [Jiella flava]